MFGVDSFELLIIVLVAVVVIGPKDLPRVMRTVGHWVGRARGMATQFRSGVDQMVRESEIAELEQKWREQNEAIMRAHPAGEPETDWGLPSAPPPPDGSTAPVSLDKPAAAAAVPTLFGKPLPSTYQAEPAALPSRPNGRRQPPSFAPPLVKPADIAARNAAEGGETA